MARTRLIRIGMAMVLGVVVGVGSAAAVPALCSGLPVTLGATPGEDTLIGADGADVIQGFGGDDRTDGLGGNAVICGGREPDQLRGSRGADDLYGGPGVDWVSYLGAPGGVTVDLWTGAVVGADTATGIETVKGLGHADRLLRDARESHGGPGNDRLDGGSGSSSVAHPKSDTPVVVDLTIGSATGEGDDVLAGSDDDAELTVKVDGVDIPSQLVPPLTLSATARHYTFGADTTLTDALVLRSGDTVELRNGARLSFGPGGYLDTQGTPTETWTVDANGAIEKNLVRDIRVYGSGDIMFMAGSLPSTITWTEFDLEPKQEPDHYPLHWHKTGTSPAGTVLDGVVVRNSTNRCIVPHGVDGITIRDTICDTIQGTAIWWNPPTPPAGSSTEVKRAWVEDNSNDVVLDHVLVDNVTVPPGDNGYRNFGFQLQCGHGNEVRNSWANNVAGKSHSGGWYWASKCNLNAGGATWVFQDNGTSNSNACAFSWQNVTGPHLMDGMRCHNSPVLGYGAYNMTTTWRRIESNGTTHSIKSVGTTIENSDLGHVVFETTPKYGVVTIRDSSIERVRFNQAKTKAGRGHVVRITDSGVTCDDWSGTPAAATSLTIDGEVCF